MPGVGAKTEIAEFAQQILLVRIETLHELRVLQLLLTLFRTHPAENAEPAGQNLLAVLWQILPARRKIIDDFLAFCGRHTLEREFTVTHRLSLLRRQLIPALEVAANLLLPFWWKTAESGVVAHETLLLFRRTIAQILDPFWRQTHQCAGIRLALLFLRLFLSPLLLTDSLPLCLPLRAWALAACAEKCSLRRRRASETHRKQQRCQPGAELYKSTHHKSRLSAAPGTRGIIWWILPLILRRLR